jgi:hypothetical protein
MKSRPGSGRLCASRSGIEVCTVARCCSRRRARGHRQHFGGRGQQQKADGLARTRSEPQAGPAHRREPVEFGAQLVRAGRRQIVEPVRAVRGGHRGALDAGFGVDGSYRGAGKTDAGGCGHGAGYRARSGLRRQRGLKQDKQGEQESIAADVHEVSLQVRILRPPRRANCVNRPDAIRHPTAIARSCMADAPM